MITRFSSLSRVLWAMPRKNSISSILVGPGLPIFASVTRLSGKYVQLTTGASPPEEEPAQQSFDEILSAIENAPPRSVLETSTSYVSQLCKVGNVSAAFRLLKSLRSKNISLGPSAYNLILVAAGENNDIEILSRVFKHLVVCFESPLPTASYLDLAKGFLKTNDCVRLLRFVEEVSELTFPSNTVVMNRVIFAFAECGQFDKALLIFDHLKDMKCKPDLVTYNTVLDILGRAGRLDEMLGNFSAMKEAGIIPDFVSYNTLLNHLRRVGRLDLCLVYFKEMGDHGIEPDLLTYTALIGSFGRSGHIEGALSLFTDMKERQISPSVYIYRSLINCLKKMGKMEKAMALSEEMNSSPGKLAGPKHFKRKGR